LKNKGKKINSKKLFKKILKQNTILNPEVNETFLELLFTFEKKKNEANFIKNIKLTWDIKMDICQY